MSKTNWDLLGEYLRETHLLASIQNTLYWDQNTAMPSSAANWRGEQLTLLARQLHSRQISPKFEGLINEAKQEFKNKFSSGDLDEELILEKLKNIELLEQDLNRQRKLDPELVSHLAIAQVEGYSLWNKAKIQNNFSSFAPALKTLILLRQEQAKQIDEPRSIWETLAQPYEPDFSKKRMNELFDPLRIKLPEILERYSHSPIEKLTKWDLEEKTQLDLCNELLKKWGRNEDLTFIGRSPHPFSITLGPKDFRLTTRVVPWQPLSCFLATAHEWGHSLYEQGLPGEGHKWFAWPLSQAQSMGLHESQSLFWENRIARSRAFSNRFWREFSKAGAPFKSEVDMWKAMNPMSPGLNRVEADELSYGLHILIRTDLEIALLEDGLEVEDLPCEWNKRYKDLLGVTPKNDSEGCLQDVHWSEGSFGYFPSYLLGHLISAQLSEAMSESLRNLGIKGLDPIGICVRDSKESHILSWLRKEVHQHGRKLNADQLVEQVTKRELTCDSFLNYLENKLNSLSSAS